MALHDLKAGRRRRRLLGDPQGLTGRTWGGLCFLRAGRQNKGRPVTTQTQLQAEGGPHIPERHLHGTVLGAGRDLADRSCPRGHAAL